MPCSNRGEQMMTISLLTTVEAAEYLSVSKAFLERDRWAGARIPFIRVGSRAVRYKLSDLNSYIESNQRRSTCDSGAGV